MKALQAKFIACRILLVAALGTASSCHDTELEAQVNTESTTAPIPCVAGKLVRAVTNVKGFISYLDATHQYCIVAAEPGTVDKVDVGVLCEPLAANLRASGTQVLFSGIYKEHPSPPATPAGYDYYYLEISSIRTQ